MRQASGKTQEKIKPCTHEWVCEEFVQAPAKQQEGRDCQGSRLQFGELSSHGQLLQTWAPSL